MVDQQAPNATWLLASGGVERLPGAFAVGAGVSLARSRGELWGGLRGGFATMTPSRPEFELRQLNLALELGWQPSWGLGVRAQLGWGADLALISPRGQLEPEAGTKVSAWFAETRWCRPIRVGALALVPEVGARLFVADRVVNVDGRPALRIRGVAPNVGLGLAYVLD